MNMDSTIRSLSSVITSSVASTDPKMGTVICTTLMTGDGYGVAVISTQQPKSDAVCTKYHWMFPRVVNLKVQWLMGDPLCSNDKIPWVRWDKEAEISFSHHDAVGHIRALNEAGYLEDPQYMGKTIPSLFHYGADHMIMSMGYTSPKVKAQIDADDTIDTDNMEITNA